MDNEVKEISKVDPWLWAYYNNIRIGNEVFLLEKHAYLMDFMQSHAQDETVMKATQAGYTLAAMVAKALHPMIHNFVPEGVLYVFPSEKDVTHFSQSRFTPLIMDNPATIGRYIKKTNNIMLKRVGRSSLYFAGGKMTQTIGGLAKESAALRSKPVDITILDELDLMDANVDEMVKARMAHSELKWIRRLSNPTIPNWGIHKYFLEGDQRYWNLRCNCGKWTCAVREYERCVDCNKDILICPKCGRPLNRDDGEWVADFEREKKSWQWSHFDSSYISPKEIIEKLENPPDGNLQPVYNYDLGLPYIAAENQLTIQDVLSCCGNEGISLGDEGPCAMGVDVGNLLHVVIGKKISSNRLKVIWCGEVPDFNRLYDIGIRFGVKSCVVDIAPEGHKAREFQSAFPCLVYLCRYQDRCKVSEKMDDNAGVITVDRTGIFDKSHDYIIKKRTELPRQGPQVEEFANQMCNVARVLEEVGQEGSTSKVYRYRTIGNGQDHFRSAFNYFILACDYVQMTSTVRPWSRKDSNEYTREVAFA